MRARKGKKSKNPKNRINKKEIISERNKLNELKSLKNETTVKFEISKDDDHNFIFGYYKLDNWIRLMPKSNKKDMSEDQKKIYEMVFENVFIIIGVDLRAAMPTVYLIDKDLQFYEYCISANKIRKNNITDLLIPCAMTIPEIYSIQQIEVIYGKKRIQKIYEEVRKRYLNQNLYLNKFNDIEKISAIKLKLYDDAYKLTAVFGFFGSLNKVPEDVVKQHILPYLSIEDCDALSCLCKTTEAKGNFVIQKYLQLIPANEPKPITLEEPCGWLTTTEEEEKEQNSLASEININELEEHIPEGWLNTVRSEAHATTLEDINLLETHNRSIIWEKEEINPSPKIEIRK